MFTKKEVQILVQAVESLPINTNVKNLREGIIRINPEIDNLIIKLKSMFTEDDAVEEVGSEVEAVETVEAEESTPEPEAE